MGTKKETSINRDGRSCAIQSTIWEIQSHIQFQQPKRVIKLALELLEGKYGSKASQEVVEALKLQDYLAQD